MKIKHIYPTICQWKLLKILSKGSYIAIDPKQDDLGGIYIESSTGETVQQKTVKACLSAKWIEEHSKGYVITETGRQVANHSNHKAHTGLSGRIVRYSVRR